MELTSKVVFDGEECLIEYEEINGLSQLPEGKATQVYGVCFYDGKMVIVHNGKKDTWGLVGGTIEPGEGIEEAMRREIKEESNMEVLAWRPVGFQKVTRPDGSCIQLRVACQVRPYGEFVSDPAGTIDKIAIIDLDDHKKYFDWGKIGDEIIRRAVELSGLMKGFS